MGIVHYHPVRYDTDMSGAGPVPTLCSRYEQASDMLEQAAKYYNGLTMAASASQHDVKMWEEAIEHAEQTRLCDPAAMDIYAAQERESHHETPSFTEDQISDLAPVDQWLRMALDIEEAQCVFCWCRSDTF